MRSKTPAALLATAVLAVGLSSVTTASAAHTSAGDQVYACVIKTTRYVRLVNASTKCRTTEFKTSWGGQGQQGVATQGPQGERGRDGKDGKDGIGTQGPRGPQGLPGRPGVKGDTGPAGTPGADGVDGRDGGMPPVYWTLTGKKWQVCKLTAGYAVPVYDCDPSNTPPTPTPTPTPTPSTTPTTAP